MLRLDDSWVWDSWAVDDGERYHLFHLRAPRSLGDPVRRHLAAVIGHSSSDDLVSWRRHPDALLPAASGWDDLALWTGSVVRGGDDRWWMFYTAVNSGGHGVKDQRIGLAVSDDLDTWQRASDGPVVEPDPRWYKTLSGEAGPSETWRDPFVFRDPGGDGWHMLITARAVGAAPNDDGVLAHARSHDLLHWTLGPPVTEPGAGFGQLEVAQVRVVEGRPLLVFTCHPDEQTPQRRGDGAGWSTWSVIGDDLCGPWRIEDAVPLTVEPRLFAAPLLQTRDGGWALVGFRNLESEGRCELEILDPVPVRLGERGLVAR